MVTFKLRKCIAVRVPLPSLPPLSKGVMCVVYMETGAHYVSLSGYVLTL